jgi:PLD-like domain
MIKFLAEDIWTSIKQLSKKSKLTKVAVAYFGTNGAKQLNLKKSDTLIVAMSINNVKMGQVNPFEIEKLYKKGVNIFTVQNLHSKIYLFDNEVIIGSANVSTNSENTLLEAGILTNDPTTISNANIFLENLSVERVEQDYIEVCKEKYNPPKNFDNKRKTVSTTDFKGQLSRLWIISTKHSKRGKEDEILLEKELPKFENKLVNKKSFIVTDVEYGIDDYFINNIKEGDILIELFNHKVRVDVIKPQRVLGITINKKTKKAFLRVEARKTEINKPWYKLELLLKRNNIKAIKKTSTREIKNDNTKKVILDYFND